MSLPSVIALKSFIKPSENPNFTRFNVFLRDKFTCQYCGDKRDLTFDHLLPKSKGGVSDWENVVTACSTCNVIKGGRLYSISGMKVHRKPFRPTIDSWTEHIAGKEPEDMLSCILWRVRYIKVKLYIEHYIKAHNELPSGVHFIMNFDDPDDDLPENLGDNSGFVNFDECPKSTI